MAFKQLIMKNNLFLLKTLDCSHEFLGALLSNAAIQDRIESIKEQPSDEKTDALLSAFLKVDDRLQDSLLNDVIEALRSSGQDHIADIFRGKSVLMSDEHYYRKLQKNMAELCKCMDPENGLLNQLFSAEVISYSESQRVRCATGLNEMTRKLVEMFMKKSDDAFEALIKALNEVGQTHVTYILTKNGTLPLSQKLRDEVISNRDKLLASMYSKSLVSVLMSKGVLTEYDQQRVESRRIEDEKNEKILDLLVRKSQSAFCNFIAALLETHHEHVVSELIGTEIAARISIIPTDAGRICAANVESELRRAMQDAFRVDETRIQTLNDVLQDRGEAVFTDVEEGSIIVKFRCKNVEALQKLHSDKTLDALFTKTFCCPPVIEGLESISLEIADGQFQQCSESLAALKLMTLEHREALLSSWKFLVHKMTVCGDLLDRLSLCEQRRQAIEAASTDEEQVRTLLDIVSRQPDSAFTQLLNALRDTQQEHAALILGWPLLDRSDEHPLPQQPEAVWKTMQVSMRHLISKCDSIDEETTAAVGNIQTSFSALSRMCGQRTERGDANAAEPHQIDACRTCKSSKMTEVTENGRTTAKQPVLASTSTQTASKGNQPFAVENRPCVFDVLPSSEPAYGVTSLHNLLYVLRADCIDVYTTTPDFTSLGSLPLAGLDCDEWNDLTSSLRYNSLYVADCVNRLIRAVELKDRSVRQWVVDGRPCGVSVTPDDTTLLVTFADPERRQLLELRLADGDWLRCVQLSADIQRPWHAVKLTSGHYVVTHSCARGLPGQHRVCKVDSAGSVLSTYGARSGSETGHVSWPSHVTLGGDDEDELVFVADSSNNRIVLLRSTMQFVQHYVGSLSRPCRIHIERATRRLYVSEFGGRLLAVPLNDCLTPACPSVRLVPKPSRSSA